MRQGTGVRNKGQVNFPGHQCSIERGIAFVGHGHKLNIGGQAQ